MARKSRAKKAPSQMERIEQKAERIFSLQQLLIWRLVRMEQRILRHIDEITTRR